MPANWKYVTVFCAIYNFTTYAVVPLNIFTLFMLGMANDTSPEMMTPVQEVQLYLLHESVKQQIQTRAQERLISVASQSYKTPKSAKKSKKHTQTKKRKAPRPDDVIVVSDYSDDEDAPASAAASATTTAPPAVLLPRTTKVEPPSLEQLQVPKTIRQEWMRVERLYYDGECDAPKCPCPNCPYSARGPLWNRFNLIQRLVELEHFLWGVGLGPGV